MSILPVTLVQMALLVPNLKQGCATLHRAYGWGPFLGGGEGVLADHTYCGQPADPIRIRGVFVQTGGLAASPPSAPCADVSRRWGQAGPPKRPRKRN